ncbi:HAMP domain-containing histidine kinase, partial [bacterium]|nr:HAMP domain-containing histidine kinase [bacterium]
MTKKNNEKTSIFLKVFLLVVSCSVGPSLVLGIYELIRYNKVVYGHNNPLMIVIGISILLSLVVSGIIAFDIANPIKALVDNIRYYKKNKKILDNQCLGRNDEFGYLCKEYHGLIEEIEKYQEQLQNDAELHAKLQIASQVAHDIRSPLSALNMVTHDLKELPEEERLIIRSAVQRIEDIANDLATKRHKAQGVGLKEKNQNNLEVKAKLLSSLVEQMVSEKRTEYRSKTGVNIESQFDATSYGLFAKINSREFKRIISNLINNSIEALKDKGNISLSMTTVNDSMIQLSVTDDGEGIPADIIPKLMQKGASFGKEEHKKSGSGLGLYHAKETIESWGGKIFIESKIDFGTSVTIFLPKQFSPDWFLPEINIPGTMKYAPRIVILDDDESIHRVWDTRFNEVKLPNENVYHFYNPDQIINWYTSKKLLLMKAPLLVLCDYELLDCDKTGLQVIEELGIEKNAVLVTSHYEERNIRNNCARLGVKLLPKNLAGFVPISVIEKDEKTINDNLEPKTDQNCDAILIDDDYLVHTSWNIIAKRCGKIIRCYADPKDFVTNSKNINKSTPLYIDSNLGDDVKGEELAKEYFEQGFENIYLATGYSVEDFPNMPWIKGVVGKEPPF